MKIRQVIFSIIYSNYEASTKLYRLYTQLQFGALTFKASTLYCWSWFFIKWIQPTLKRLTKQDLSFRSIWSFVDLQGFDFIDSFPILREAGSWATAARSGDSWPNYLRGRGRRSQFIHASSLPSLHHLSCDLLALVVSTPARAWPISSSALALHSQ